MNISIVVAHFELLVACNEYGLAKSLADLGHEVNVITTRTKSPRELMEKKDALEARIQNFEINYVPVLADFLTNPIVYGVSNYLKNSEVVLLQEDYHYICHKAFKESKERGIPTILSTERTNWPENLLVRNIYKVFNSTANKKLREGANALTAHCTAAKEFWIRELKVQRNIEVIHVGVDTQIFRPQKVENVDMLDGHFKILTVARAYPFKGLRHLIEAMKYVSKKVPGAKCHILSHGPERKKLEKLVKELGLGQVVNFIDKAIPNQQMPELYSQCDIYVQPSLIEPFGIAVLEAEACGKPVIGTRVGGMKDTIKDGITGYHVEPANSKELGRAITKLALDPEKLKKMGENARKHAQNFDWRIIALKYDKLIQRVLQGSI